MAIISSQLIGSTVSFQRSSSSDLKISGPKQVGLYEKSSQDAIVAQVEGTTFRVKLHVARHIKSLQDKLTTWAELEPMGSVPRPSDTQRTEPSRFRSIVLTYVNLYIGHTPKDKIVRSWDFT